MHFGEAIEALKQGKKVKRGFWGGYWFLSKDPDVAEKVKDGYVRNYTFKNDIIVAVLKDNGGCAPAQAYQADLLAEDWECVN